MTGATSEFRRTDGLGAVRRLLRDSVGEGGHAQICIYTGHDGRPFVYLMALTDPRGVSVGQSPQHLLGFDAWLRVVEQLGALLAVGSLPGEGRFRDITF